MSTQAEITKLGAAAGPVGRQGFLLSRALDVDFALGGGVLLSVLFFLLWRADAGFLIAATLFAIFSDLPHVLHSSARIWFDPRERTLYGRRYLLSLAVIGLCVTGLAVSGHLVVLLAVWVLWQFFHVAKQHFGMINIYAAKDGYRGGRKLVKYALFAGCFAPFYYRLHAGMGFSEYVVFGNKLPFSNLELPPLPVPAFTVALVYAVAAVLLGAYVREQLRLRARHERPLPVVAQLTLATALLSYNAAYLLVSDLYALILIAATVHSLQYHVISIARNRGRLTEAAGEEEPEVLLRMWEPKMLPIYFAGLFVIGAILAHCELVIWGIIPLTVVLHHFYLDSFLWKPKGNKHLAAHLNLQAGARTPR